MLWRYTTSTGLTVFTYLVDLTVVTVAIPYFFSAIAQLTYLVSRRRRVHGWLLARDLTVAGASVLFSMWVTFAVGLPGRLPGPRGDPGRAHPVRLPERPPRSVSASQRADGARPSGCRRPTAPPVGLNRPRPQSEGKEIT